MYIVWILVGCLALMILVSLYFYRMVTQLGEVVYGTRYALIICLESFQNDAMDSDGYSDTQLAALRVTTAELGIKLVETIRKDSEEEIFYKMVPSPRERMNLLRERGY